MQPTAATSACSACTAAIVWVTTEGGKRMPLDPDPAADGVVVLVHVDGKQRGRVLTGRDLPAQRTAYRPHWQTCPHSDDFRRRKGRPSPRCQACEGPMDAELARLEAWTTHPCCDPRYLRPARRTT